MYWYIAAVVACMLLVLLIEFAEQRVIRKERRRMERRNALRERMLEEDLRSAQRTLRLVHDQDANDG